MFDCSCFSAPQPVAAVLLIFLPARTCVAATFYLIKKKEETCPPLGPRRIPNFTPLQQNVWLAKNWDSISTMYFVATAVGAGTS